MIKSRTAATTVGAYFEATKSFDYKGDDTQPSAATPKLLETAQNGTVFHESAVGSDTPTHDTKVSANSEPAETKFVTSGDGIYTSGKGSNGEQVLFQAPDEKPGPTETIAWTIDDNDDPGDGVGTPSILTDTITEIHGDGGANTINGSGADEDIYGHGGDDTINGNSGEDYIYGGEGDDDIFGGDGDDWLLGDGGEDEIFGGDGRDRILGGSGSDELFGDADHDTLYGGSNADDLYGGEGNDSLYGGSGNDNLFGGLGDDGIVDRTGDDVYTGGEGADIFWFSVHHDPSKEGGGQDIITDFELGVDQLVLYNDGGGAYDVSFADYVDQHAFGQADPGVVIEWENGLIRLQGIDKADLNPWDVLLIA